MSDHTDNVNAELVLNIIGGFNRILGNYRENNRKYRYDETCGKAYYSIDFALASRSGALARSGGSITVKVVLGKAAFMALS